MARRSFCRDLRPSSPRPAHKIPDQQPGALPSKDSTAVAPSGRSSRAVRLGLNKQLLIVHAHGIED